METLLSKLLLLILLPIRYYTTDTAFGVGDIAMVAGDEVHVYVENCLTCGFVHVDAYVVAIGVMSLVQYLLDVLEHGVHILTLLG
jgi:hypothetical protein